MTPRQLLPARSAAALVLVACSAALAGAEPAGEPVTLETRVFTLRWKSLSDAAFLVRPLVSQDAMIQMEPRLQALTIKDWPSNLDSVAQAVASFDVPPRAVDVTIVLVRATKTPGARPIAEELRSIKNSVDSVVEFASYEVLGEVQLAGVEGDDVLTAIGRDDAYRVGFQVGAVDDRSATVILDDLSLSRRRGGPAPAGAEAVYETVMTLTYPAPSGRKVVLGATRQGARESGVLLVIEAAIRPAAGASTSFAGSVEGGERRGTAGDPGSVKR